MIDVARLRKGLEFALAHPEEHDQSSWAERTVCGTTMCLAGTVVVQAGYTLLWQPGATTSGYARHPKTGARVPVPTQARDLLGITSAQATRLFLDSETIDELYVAANDITDGEIEIPIELHGELS